MSELNDAYAKVAAAQLSKVEAELRADLVGRVRDALVEGDAFRPGEARLIAETAVRVFEDFIREGNRVRELAEGPGVAWH